MKIIEIHIYGYGKLEYYHIASLKELQVFYGENEAGKSTIMSFINSILFGFPGKQSAELRYEPKNHSKYGGKIKASFPNKGIAVIERVKGKAAGDVTVSLEDGTIGGEELLKDLLGRMDKSIFQGIFSFNVHGLQNVQAMKGEELGKYLFSAGTLGTDKLFNAEGMLQKEMEQRFKPGGKRPMLNEKLKELREVQASLKEAEQQNERYSQYVSEKEQIQRDLTRLENEISYLEREVSHLKELKRNKHLVIEEANLRKKLEESRERPFPEDGLRRLEKLEQEMKPIRSRMLWIKDKKAALLKEVSECKPDFALLDQEEDIHSKLEKLPVYDQLKQEKSLLERKVEELTEEISQINDHLHIEFNDENIQNVNTSVFIKEQAESIQHRQLRLADKKLELEAAFEEERNALVEMEKHAARLENEFLSDEMRTQFAEQMSINENKEAILSELNEVRGKVSFEKERVKDEQARRERQRKKDFYQFAFVGGILLVLSLWGILEGNWLLVIAGAVGIIVMAIFNGKALREPKKKPSDKILSELLEKERSLNEKLGKQPSGTLFAEKSMLVKDEELRQQHRELSVRIQQQSTRYDKVIEQFEKWELEEAELKEQKAELIEKLGLSTASVPTRIFDAYSMIEKQKSYFRERKRTAEKLRTISAVLQEIENSLSGIGERFLQQSDMTPAETGRLLKNKLREAVGNKSNFEQKNAKLDELEEEYSALEKNLLVLSDEKESLLNQAEAENEDQFRHAAKMDEQLKNWSARLADLVHQLGISGISQEDMDVILHGEPLDAQMDEKLQLAEKHKIEQTRLLNQLMDVKHRMGLLEKGGIYSELLHKYKQLKHEFTEDAKEWGKYAIAKDLLAKTIERYKEERMPRMIAAAEKFLFELTDGNYLRILPQSSGSGFLIERKDHTFFGTNELSQATAEQVYVSIRLALAAIHFERYPMPLIIDDSFVNFDHKRAARMVDLLKEFSGNQILIFTCHRHLLEHFTASEIVHLGENSYKAVLE